MKEALDAEHAGGKPHWYEVFTGPRMRYRTVLGTPGLPAAYWGEFLLLLRHNHLRGHRSEQQLRNSNHPRYG